MEKIFIIELIWISSDENRPEHAVGYKSIGWVSSEEEAQEVVRNGKTYTVADCWAIREPVPEFRYRKLTKMQPNGPDTK